MRRSREFLSHLAGGPLWAGIGILLLLAFNAAFDLASGSMFGPGAFLHVSMREGSPSGAIIDILNHASKIIILAVGLEAGGALITTFPYELLKDVGFGAASYPDTIPPACGPLSRSSSRARPR